MQSHVLFELNPYNIQRTGPKGIKARYEEPSSWQLAFLERMRRKPNGVDIMLLSKANNVYKFQGQPNKPVYIVAEKKIPNNTRSQALFRNIVSNQRFSDLTNAFEIKEYMEGMYGGLGIKNQFMVRPPLQQSEMAAKRVAMTYLNSSNKALPFYMRGLGTILSADNKRLIFMNMSGRLLQITHKPGAASKRPSKSSGAGPSSKSKSPGAGPSSPKSKSPSAGPSSAGQTSGIPWNTKAQTVITFYPPAATNLYLKEKLERLGIPVSPKPTYAELRKHYKKLAMALHSNKLGPSSNEDKFQEIAAVIDYLKNKGHTNP